MSWQPNAKYNPPTFVRRSSSLPAQKTSATAEAWGKKQHWCKPLQKEFRHHGFIYRQIAREGDLAVYQQTWKGNSGSAAFEVIRIRRREGFEISGRFVEPAEVYPNSEAWGVDGWTAQDKEAAFRKLREIVTSPTAPARSGQKVVGCVEKSPT